MNRKRSSLTTHARWLVLLVMIVGLVPAVSAAPITASDAAPSTAPLLQTSTLTLNVVSARTELRAFGGAGVTKGDVVTAYKYIINVDNTGTTEQRSPAEGCSPASPGYPDSCHWVSIAGAASSSPIYTQGDQSDFPMNLPPGRYLISVLADGYKLDGAHFTVPLPDPGIVTVELQPTPLPTGMIQAEVFQDLSPVNSAPDVPAERGIPGFQGHILDYIGEVTTDVFGDPLCGTGICLSKCYDVDALGNDTEVAPAADGLCPVGSQGKIKIPNLGPNRYALSVVPPNGSGWIQTTTLEGNHDWDSWVMEDATGLDTEFVVAGEPFPAIFFGFVPGPAAGANIWTNPDLTVASPGSTIRGLVDAVKVYIPPKGGLGLPGTIWGGTLGARIDKPIESPWIALTDLQQGDTALYVVHGNPDGSFEIPNVPDGNYTLTWWDEPQDYILDLINVTVAGGDVDMSILPLTGWWTQFEGYVFSDDNRNGVMDWQDSNMNGCPDPGEGERGMANFPLTLRKRENSLMDRGATLVTTDGCGRYYMENAYPMTQWLVMEAYNDLYYTTGVTYQADNQPTPTTLLGAGVDVSVLPIIGLSGRLDWGIHAYDPAGTRGGIDPRNGGIVGTVSYDTTRNEFKPQYAAVEDWQPGISGLTVNLYATIACNTNPGTPCSTGPGLPYELAPDGSYAKGSLLNTYVTETWQRPGANGNINGDGVCIPRDVDGNPLAYPADQQVTAQDTDCLEGPLMGIQFQNGYSTLDGNYGFGDGCFLADGVTPGLFDPDTGACSTGALSALPGGRDYLVEVEIPTEQDVFGVDAAHPDRPLYQVTKEEDINIYNGDQFAPQVPPPACAGPLHTVDVAGVLTDGYPSVTLPGGIVVPASTPIENTPFADAGGTPYEGMVKPECSTKLVQLNNGKSIVPTFNLFTDVPIPGRFWGLVVDDLNFSANPQSLLYGEKAGIPFAPVGIYDYTNRLVYTVESDYNGLWDVLLPSTNRISCPTPSGVCANLYRFVGNDPGVAGRLNTNYKPQFRTIAAEFEAFPGLLVPADLAPTQVGVTVQLPGGQFNQVSCALEPTTPQIFAVDRPYGSQGQAFTITGQGFGAGGGAVNFDGVAVPSNWITGWSDTQITVSPQNYGGLPPQEAGPHQVSIATSTGQRTINGLTYHYLRSTGSANLQYNPNIYEVGPGRTYAPADTLPLAADHAIQQALDAAAASPGDDLVVVYPNNPSADPRQNPRGAYYENLIITSPVKLQGVGPGSPDGAVRGSIIDGGAFGGDSPVFTDWYGKIGTLTWDGNQTIYDGAAISIFTSSTAFPQTFDPKTAPSIDGFNLRGGDQQGFPGNINQIGGLPTGLPANLITQGGAVFANAYARNLQITNNIVQNNGGAYGTIRIGNPDLAPDPNNHNEGVRIANNRIIQNAGTNLAGGIGLFAGADNYEVAANDICGNFSAEYGGGLSVYGLSSNGNIHHNRVYFNASYDEGGGIMIAGQLPADPSTLSPGSGPANIYNNLIQANLGNDDGGGLRFLMAAGPNNSPFNVYNNMIVNNVSTHEGGGIGINDAPNVRVYNNTIMKNLTTATAVTSDGSPAPAGLSTSANSALLRAQLPGSPVFSDPLLFNNIFWDNRAGTRAGTTVTGLGIPGDASPINNWDLGVADGTGLLSPTNSVLQVTNGTNPSGSNSSANPNVISLYDTSVSFAPWRNNPAFVSPIMVAVELPANLLGNYRLLASSPAINLGAPSKNGVNAPATDFDNESRPAGGGYDSGADEYWAIVGLRQPWVQRLPLLFR